MNATFYKTLREWQQLEPERERMKEVLGQKFMLEFNYNSNHIEGNTLTYGQTELLLLFGVMTGEAKVRDIEEMKASSVGLKMVIEEAKSGERPLSESFIRQVHKILLREDYEEHRQRKDGSVFSYTVHAGRYKTRPNSVITRDGTRFEYASPEETPALMTDLVVWYNKEAERGILDPLELAALFHYRYIRIHPFEDGNGRIARLLVNYILASHGYPMLVVPTQTKIRYLDALSKCDGWVGTVPADGAHAPLKKIIPFVNYLQKLLIKKMREDIALVGERKTNRWSYNGEIIEFQNETMARIVNAICGNPKITLQEISEEANINKSAVQRRIKTLLEKGYLIRVGSNTKGGEWHITLTRV